MPKIQIEAPTQDDPRMVTQSWGAIVKVDGRELEHVREVSVRLALDECVTARVEVFATESFKFESNVDLHINVIPEPGKQLVVRQLSDGRFAYTSEEMGPPEAVGYPVPIKESGSR